MSALARQLPPEDDDGDSCALPPQLAAQMSRLQIAGHSLLPLGGADGKKPLAKFNGRQRLPLETVVHRMVDDGSATFGIRLPGMLVVDVDSDTPEAAAYLASRFPPSPVEVRTKRGFHLYFRTEGPAPRAVRLPGISIDFKTGGNQYVVGPGSIRPDGTRYDYGACCGLGPVGELPWFRLVDQDAQPQPAPRSPGGAHSIPIGQRHIALRRRAHDMALGGDTAEAMIDALREYRDADAESPEGFSDDELMRIVVWCVERRAAGQLWSRGNQHVPIPAAAIDDLAARGEPTALMLLNVLFRYHGGRREPFAIAPDAMRDAGIVNLDRRQVYRARDALVRLGYLAIVLHSRGPRSPTLYRLAGPERREKRSSLDSVPIWYSKEAAT